MEENRNLQIRIQSWEHYAIVLQSYKAVHYLRFTLHFMLKVTFEIKSNIYFEGKKKFYRPPKWLFFVMWGIGSEQVFKVGLTRKNYLCFFFHQCSRKNFLLFVFLISTLLKLCCFSFLSSIYSSLFSALIPFALLLFLSMWLVQLFVTQPSKICNDQNRIGTFYISS